jgi:tetratricopeptide (TPR) repeat protein
MKETWRKLVLSVFLVGLFLTGLVGTSAPMTFIWPAYGMVGLAGALSIGLLFQGISFRIPLFSAGCLVVFFGYLLARASAAPVTYFAREDAALVVCSFLVYGLCLVLLLTPGSRHRLVDLLALLVTLNLGFAVLQATVDPTLWILPGYDRTYSDRIGGLFNHPDHFAAFLAMLVPLWISVALFGRRSRSSCLGAAALGAASVLAILASGSGVGMLALGAGLAAFALTGGVLIWQRLPEGTRRTSLRRGAVASLVLAILLAAASVPIARALDHSVLEKGGQLSLLQVWKAGWAQFTEAPLAGTGSRTSYLYGRRFRSETLNSASAEPEFIHNEYLQVAADYGIAGLLLLLLAAGLHLVSGYRFTRAYLGFAASPGSFVPRSDHLALVLGALASLASLTVSAAFDFVLHLPVFAMIAAAFLAVLAAPDPMAAALTPPAGPRLLPGGVPVFASRALLFGFGTTMALFGIVFSQSEYHYERARLAFESDRTGFNHLRHLHDARALDGKNPFIFSLSAHAQVAGIQSGMPEPARLQALGQADGYFSHARHLYPEDIFAAIGHAAVLEELGRHGEALERLREAREFAPDYGNLMLAEAEHHLRHGRVADAETMFSRAMSAAAFRDSAAARRGLMTVVEWKLIAEQDGIDWRVMPDPVESEPLLAGPAGYRRPAEARIENRNLAGKAAAEGSAPEDDTTSPESPESPESPTSPAEPGAETTDDGNAAP